MYLPKSFSSMCVHCFCYHLLMLNCWSRSSFFCPPYSVSFGTSAICSKWAFQRLASLQLCLSLNCCVMCRRQSSSSHQSAHFLFSQRFFLCLFASKLSFFLPAKRVAGWKQVFFSFWVLFSMFDNLFLQRTAIKQIEVHEHSSPQWNALSYFLFWLDLIVIFAEITLVIVGLCFVRVFVAHVASLCFVSSLMCFSYSKGMYLASGATPLMVSLRSRWTDGLLNQHIKGRRWPYAVSLSTALVERPKPAMCVVVLWTL